MKNKLALLTTIHVLTAVSTTTFADEVGHWYVTPQVGGINADNDRLLTDDEEWLYGLAIGKHLSEAWSLEFAVNGTRFDREGTPVNLSLYGFSLDLLRVFNRGGVVAPYISVGAGVASNEFTPGTNSTDFMSQAGVGMLLRLWQNSNGTSTFMLRPQIQVRWDDAGRNDLYRDAIATLGFQFSFGSPPAPPPAPPPPPPPPPEPAAQTAPAPAELSPDQRDSDNDGVTDNIDKCPGTPSGVSVDAEGCPQKGSITLEGVTFELNSARLTPESLPVLDGIAAGLIKYPRLRVELQGHTDSSGSDEYNMELSRQRADAVRDYLLKQGVPTTQLVSKGYGETQPIADNSTPEGRARNRRVVMYVLENPGDVEVEGEGEVK